MSEAAYEPASQLRQPRSHSKQRRYWTLYSHWHALRELLDMFPAVLGCRPDLPSDAFVMRSNAAAAPPPPSQPPSHIPPVPISLLKAQVVNQASIGDTSSRAVPRAATSRPHRSSHDDMSAEGAAAAEASWHEKLRGGPSKPVKGESPNRHLCIVFCVIPR